MRVYGNGAPVVLPKVGDRVEREMYIGSSVDKKIMPGTVVYVNHRHLYYSVLFDLGFKEDFKCVL